MPEWGLTKEMRTSRPYELDEWWLAPGKVITDPIHGDIFITTLEQAFVDTPAMQRLRRVRQLGTTHLVYPGATHTRFAHSLGAVRAVQDLLDMAMGQRNGNHAVADLFDEWERDEHRQSSDDTSDELAVARDPSDSENPRTVHLRKLAEATILARLGALLHDVSHLPYGHSIEDDLELLQAHDENTARFERLWHQMLDAIRSGVQIAGDRSESAREEIDRRIADLHPLSPGERLYAELRPLILSKERDADGDVIDPVKALSEYPFVADLVGNTICADLLDYLPRDHRFTGLPMSLGQRFMSSFYVIPDDVGGIYRKRMALLIHRDGRPRQDVVTEIIKHLRYRYELQERVLVHHLKLTADAMIGKMFELWHEAETDAAEKLGEDALLAAYEAIPLGFRAAHLRTSERDGEAEPDAAEIADVTARWRLEELLLERGDDGILEHLSSGAVPADARRSATHEIARRLRDRALYRHAANAANAYSARDLHDTFGSAEDRRNLERAAARHAGIKSDWHVVLWVPGPKMRLKLAEVLVDHGEGIAKFVDYSTKGSDIYEDHRRLWTVSVFVHPTVTEEKTRLVLAKLAQLMRISWDRHQDQLGADPDIAPQRLAAIEVCDANYVTNEVRELIVRGVSEQAARGGADLTHEEIVDRFRELRAPH